MTVPSIVTTAASLLLTVTSAGLALPRAKPSTPLSEFTLAIREYAALHRRLEQKLPQLRVSSDPSDATAASDALASALRSARANAREGDIFAPDISELLRTRIAETLCSHGFLPDELVAANLFEADEGAAIPVVNGRFPWGRGAAMWPCIIEALPRLPNELEYRMVGADLILLDMHADLVVDILRNAVR